MRFLSSLGTTLEPTSYPAAGDILGWIAHCKAYPNDAKNCVVPPTYVPPKPIPVAQPPATPYTVSPVVQVVPTSRTMSTAVKLALVGGFAVAAYLILKG